MVANWNGTGRVGTIGRRRLLAFNPWLDDAVADVEGTEACGPAHVRVGTVTFKNRFAPWCASVFAAPITFFSRVAATVLTDPPATDFLTLRRLKTGDTGTVTGRLAILGTPRSPALVKTFGSSGLALNWVSLLNRKPSRSWAEGTEYGELRLEGGDGGVKVAVSPGRLYWKRAESYSRRDAESRRMLASLIRKQ